MQSNDYSYGVKDLYQGVFLASQDMKINGINYKKDDVLLFFDNIQGIAFEEEKSSVAAEGGFDNRRLINWSTTHSVNGVMDLGRISKIGYGIINETILNNISNIKAIRQIEKQSAKGNIVYLKHSPLDGREITISKMNQGVIVSKITEFTVKENTLILNENDIDVLVDYYFSYQTNAASIKIGSNNLPGYLKFVGKFYYTDEQGSSRKTALIEIPKVEIDGNFSINFGRNTSPIVSILRFKAIPVGERQNSKAVEIIYLDEDIDADF